MKTIRKTTRSRLLADAIERARRALSHDSGSEEFQAEQCQDAAEVLTEALDRLGLRSFADEELAQRARYAAAARRLAAIVNIAANALFTCDPAEMSDAIAAIAEEAQH